MNKLVLVKRPGEEVRKLQVGGAVNKLNISINSKLL